MYIYIYNHFWSSELHSRFFVNLGLLLTFADYYIPYKKYEGMMPLSSGVKVDESVLHRCFFRIHGVLLRCNDDMQGPLCAKQLNIMTIIIIMF